MATLIATGDHLYQPWMSVQPVNVDYPISGLDQLVAAVAGAEHPEDPDFANPTHVVVMYDVVPGSVISIGLPGTRETLAVGVKPQTMTRDDEIRLDIFRDVPAQTTLDVSIRHRHYLQSDIIVTAEGQRVLAAVSVNQQKDEPI